jgi:hypothetical protein
LAPAARAALAAAVLLGMASGPARGNDPPRDEPAAPAQTAAGGAGIPVPLSAVMNRRAMLAREQADAAARDAAAERDRVERALARPAAIESEAVRRAGDSGFSFTELTPPRERRALDGGFPVAPAPARPGLGTVGRVDDGFARAQAQFSRAAMAGTGALPADAGLSRAQARYFRSALAATGATPADEGWRRAQRQHARSAGAHAATPADAGLSRAQAQYHRSALGRAIVIPRSP